MKFPASVVRATVGGKVANTFDAADVVIATDVVAVVADADNVFAIMV